MVIVRVIVDVRRRQRNNFCYAEKKGIGIYKKSSARVVNGDKKSNSLFAMCGYNLNNSSINRNIKSSSLLNLTEEVHKTTEAKNIITTTTTKTTTRITKAAIHHKAISLSRSNAKRNIANAYVKTSYTKWQIVILTFIILLLCCTSEYYSLIFYFISSPFSLQYSFPISFTSIFRICICIFISEKQKLRYKMLCAFDRMLMKNIS